MNWSSPYQASTTHPGRRSRVSAICASSRFTSRACSASRTWWIAGAALLVLIPTLLYYGGGWLQFGYRYALDSIPFVWMLCGLAAARDEGRGGEMAWGWRILIGIGLLTGLESVYWAYHL